MRRLLQEGGLVLAGYRGTAAAEARLNPAGSPIVGVLLGDEQSAIEAAARLRDAGFLIPAIRPPTVADGTSRLRLSVCSEHTEQQIADAAAAVLKACGR
jgi:8-amino-7-oxononanoate synthase